MKKKEEIIKFIRIFLIGLILIYSLAPFLWTVITGIKSPDEVFRLPITYFPHKISFQNFKDVFGKRPFGTYILNSLIVGIGGTGLAIVTGAIISFLLRYTHLEKALRIQRLMLIIAIIPPALLVIPIFIGMSKLGLINNYMGLILTYSALNLPFAVWMLSAAFREIPKELDESARIDGFSWLGILFKIIMPVSAPAVAATSILVFIFCWNEFLLALTLMPDEAYYTVPVGIALLSGSSIYEIPWGEICAAVTITTGPVILMVALLQRWIIEGLISGAVKR
jgi:multiple sugar transport system permease protein